MSQFNCLPKSVQALIFSFLPPLDVARARLINRDARDAVDGHFFLIKKLFWQRYGVVLPANINIQQRYTQVAAELNVVFAYLRIKLHRRYVKDHVLGNDTRSQQGKDRIMRFRQDGATLVQWLQADRVADKIQSMSEMSRQYEDEYELKNDVGYLQAIFTSLLSDDNQCDLIKEIFRQPYGINWRRHTELMTAKMMIQSFMSCGAELCLALLLNKVRKHIPDLNGENNDLFADSMRDAIKFGHLGILKQLLDFGVSANQMISMSDVNPNSGVTPLICVIEGLKIYVKEAYPQIQGVEGKEQERLERAFQHRLRAYHGMINLLISANALDNEKHKLWFLNLPTRSDSIGFAETVLQDVELGTHDYACNIMNELMAFLEETKEQEVDEVLRVRVTSLIKHTLGLLLPMPSLPRQESGESEVKRCKRYG